MAMPIGAKHALITTHLRVMVVEMFANVAIANSHFRMAIVFAILAMKTITLLATIVETCSTMTIMDRMGYASDACRMMTMMIPAAIATIAPQAVPMSSGTIRQT